MRFSRRFLRMKEENQNFPQMTIIWHEIRHFHTTKSIWRQNKITNVSKRFVYHMSKPGSWCFGYVKIDQHLRLEPSIHKQRELSCAPNIISEKGSLMSFVFVEKCTTNLKKLTKYLNHCLSSMKRLSIASSMPLKAQDPRYLILLILSGAIFRPLQSNQSFARHKLLLILSYRIPTSFAVLMTSAWSAKPMMLVSASTQFFHLEVLNALRMWMLINVQIPLRLPVLFKL